LKKIYLWILGIVILSFGLLILIFHAALEVKLGIRAENAKNYTEAMKWYMLADNQGNAHADYAIGSLYWWGNGVTQDYKEAMKWYQKSAEKGNTDAEYAIGTLYENADGVIEDYVEAMKWYQKSAAQGNDTADYAIGTLYESGRGVTQDYLEAMNWYQKSAELRNDTAKYAIGSLYENGEGVHQDYREAIKWYRKSADQGNADAERKIGVFYVTGDGVTQDYQEAMKWFKKSAVQGNIAAENDIADLYEAGLGVKKDHEEAMKWAQIAETNDINTATPQVSFFEKLKNQFLHRDISPAILNLLHEAGYSEKSNIQIHTTSLAIENSYGERTQDLTFYIFSTSGPNPKVSKIKVILYNYGNDGEPADNLLAYGPMMVFQRVNKKSYAFAHYIPSEYLNSKIEKDYVVLPGKTGQFIFHYGKKFEGNPGWDKGEIGFDDIFSLILSENFNNVSSNGEAKMVAGEQGKFRLTGFKKIYSAI
jgi:TPR repeat protein